MTPMLYLQSRHSDLEPRYRGHATLIFSPVLSVVNAELQRKQKRENWQQQYETYMLTDVNPYVYK